MDKIIEKLKKILSEVSKQKKISLFAIIKKEDSDLWDLVVGGDNLETQENLLWIIGMLNKELDKNEIIMFSRVALLDSKDSFVVNLVKAFNVEGGVIEIKDSRINNIFINQAYILLSSQANI